MRKKQACYLLGALGMCALLGRFLAAQPQPLGLVKNGEFAQRAAPNESWPADWQADPACAALYNAVNDDGFADKDCLRYVARAGQTVGPVTQALALTPNTDYVLVAALKSDGTLKPAVRVLDTKGGGQLALVVSDGTTSWKQFSTRFNSGAATQALVEIWGDAQAMKSKQATAGTAAIDGVNVYRAAEAPPTIPLPPVFTPPGPNVALGKPYTLQPQPNYSYCTDPEDKTQLTDGVYTVGYFWTQKTTVGWTNANPVIITLDLQEVQPLAGLSYNTAAGTAGVSWPTSILILVSDDGQKWSLAGDLIQLATQERGAPPPEPYAVHRFATGQLRTHGRYVRLYVDQTPYAFVDEIEVYQGPDRFLEIPYAKVVDNPEVLFAQQRIRTAILWRLRQDVTAAQHAIEQSSLRAAEKQALLAQAAALAKQIDNLPEELPANFRTILPLNELHARIYALFAPLHRARGLSELTVWQNNRWDPLLPTEGPPQKPAGLPHVRVLMKRNEYRGEAFNITNASPQALRLSLTITGLPQSPNPPYISVREVLWTDTRDRRPIAAALPEATKTGPSWQITIPAGMTRQIWLECHARGLAPGTYSGKITLRGGRPGGEIVVPLTLKIYPVDFPDRPSIHLCGWDYTNGNGAYDVTPENQAALIAMLRQNYVDMPWANAGVQPQNAQFDADGHLVSELRFTNWDEWLRKWPDARLYGVYLAVGTSFAGEPMGTPRFQRMIAEWMTGWIKHLGEQGLQPQQLVLLLYDEPHEPRGYEIIKTWAQAINAAQPAVTLFEDPTSLDPHSVDPAVWPELDILCPNLPMFIAAPQPFRDFFVAQKQAGRELWFYSCSGPAKLLDPITYHRSQFWWSLRYGSTGSAYWAFGDEGGGSSWNAYMQKRAQYSPLFLAPDSVTDGKHMAAIREGVQDYEYFVILRQRIAELEAKGIRSPLFELARRLEQEGPERVIASIRPDNMSWHTPKDRSLMDQVRVEVLELLEKMAKL